MLLSCARCLRGFAATSSLIGMNEDNIGPEDVEIGEAIGVFDADPRRGVVLRIDLPPESARPLFALSKRAGADPFVLARKLLDETVAMRLAAPDPGATVGSSEPLTISLDPEDQAALVSA